MTASAMLGTFHQDAVQEFCAEFPDWADTVEELVRKGKIVIVEEKGEQHETDNRKT